MVMMVVGSVRWEWRWLSEIGAGWVMVGISTTKRVVRWGRLWWGRGMVAMVVKMLKSLYLNHYEKTIFKHQWW